MKICNLYNSALKCLLVAAIFSPFFYCLYSAKKAKEESVLRSLGYSKGKFIRINITEKKGNK